MSMFGKLYDGLKGAATSDLGTFLLQGTNGLDRKRGQAQQEIERQRVAGVRQGLFGAIDQAYAPQYPQAQSFDPSMEGSPDQFPQAPPQDPRAILDPAILRASAGGMDTSDISRQLQTMNPRGQVINGGDGSYGIFNPVTGKVEAGQLPNEYEDLKRQKMLSEIETLRALMQQRKSAASLSDAKAKTGGWAPRQPRAGGLPPIPPGFKMVNP